jgi:small subunit ribosomal protein S16
MDGIHQFTKYQLTMAVKIRLARRGRKKLAIYDVVVADAKAPRDGRFIEKIGTYNPNTDPASININNERALTWLMNGAQPTDTVKAMLSYRGILLKKHLQIGVLKGAISQEDADAKFETWKSSKESAISGKVDKLTQAKDEARKKAQDAETAKNQARLDAIKKREEEANAVVAAEATEGEATEATESPEAAAEGEATEA